MGQLANDVRAALETALEDCSKKLEAAALERRLKEESLSAAELKEARASSLIFANCSFIIF